MAACEKRGAWGCINITNKNLLLYKKLIQKKEKRKGGANKYNTKNLLLYKKMNSLKEDQGGKKYLGKTKKRYQRNIFKSFWFVIMV